MARDNTPTDRRGYERPAIGDDWAEAWDGFVEDQDEVTIGRGSIADRPTEGTYDDEFYYAVDQRTLWRWDVAASDWEPAAGLGTESDPVPGTSYYESVSTEGIDIIEIPPGETIAAQEFIDDAGNMIGSKSVQKTPDVGTTATDIFNMSSDRRIHVIEVLGRKTGAGDRFADTIKLTADLPPVVTDSTDLRGAPATRNYETNNRNLELDMSADTYNILAIADGEIDL